MAFLLHQTLLETAARAPDARLLSHDKCGDVSAAEFTCETAHFAAQLQRLGIKRDDRVGIFLPKLPLAAYAFYAVSMAGAVFVPINPLLKRAQVKHIVNDCGIRVLITNPERLLMLVDALAQCPALEHVVLSAAADSSLACPVPCTPWSAGGDQAECFTPASRIDTDIAAILYTSGSTGHPKGVVLSHRNIVEGARSVAEYLAIDPRDRILALLPFSFDYGLNQLTSAVLRGARCVLFDYVLPQDAMRAMAHHDITGLGAVPALWAQLAPLPWPASVRVKLRYITNSGGALPDTVLDRLRAALPSTRVFLMYGLTEAFRSTYLPSELIDERKGSIGKAIPNAEIAVLRSDGTPAATDEPGELVHRGALVALGYWNDPARTALRFRPLPAANSALPFAEIAVWSGDTVRRDEDGFLYFIGREDGMIKTSGYRVSPEEVEEIAYALDGVESAAAIGVPHPTLGQAIVVVIHRRAGTAIGDAQVQAAFRHALPRYMQPSGIVFRDDMPLTHNGKVDRKRLQSEYMEMHSSSESGRA